MKINHLLLVVSLIITFSVPTFACDQDGETGIVAKNDLWIGVDNKDNTEMTEELFNSILDRISEIYSPIIEEQGKELVISRDWTNGTVNAYAQQSGSRWSISMFGGLARHQAVSPDGFALVACHELGHHLGGAPKKKSWWSASWASNEGQSDYFGNMKCMRKYYENDNNQQIVKTMEIDLVVTTTCDKAFDNLEQQAVCYRTAMAGKSLANLFNALSSGNLELKFDTPDPKVVKKTNHSHPKAQCRLDTYYQAALCHADAYSDVSNDDANLGVCSRSAYDEVGIRPLCWYKPAN
ncbi:MAG: hypothetical protein HN353_11015 [Bdellovibrionales bacterium]|jgi:hypothetical protein|nr:hypothetical protein [Bdellovibrionales bacterium]MBT3525202.1 hypothetical protein [Bdellovibrionales bacterium]MBT7668665.1 hypothetical protein [Bdellovibrionales bacterium]MBT7766541.1 hypothetical protein [Bdellovibrionales bacterium]